MKPETKEKLVYAAAFTLACVELPLFVVLHPVRAYRVFFLGDPDDELCP